MYIIDLDKELKDMIWFKSQKKAAEEIGVSQKTLSRILNAKQTTKKTTAYCITKLFNKDGEILDYFKKIK